MGQCAEDIIDGTCDWSGDYMYKYNNPRGPRKETLAEKNIRKVRKELAILIEKKISQQDPQPVNNARKEVNLKYGKGWRERGLVSDDEDQWLPLNQYPIIN